MSNITETLDLIRKSLDDLELMLEQEGAIEPSLESINNQDISEEKRKELIAMKFAGIRF